MLLVLPDLCSLSVLKNTHESFDINYIIFFLGILNDIFSEPKQKSGAQKRKEIGAQDGLWI